MTDTPEYMDNSTEQPDPCNLARLFFMAVCGLEPDVETRQKGLNYWHSVVVSPWGSSIDEHNRTHGRRFFQELADMQITSKFRDKWRPYFDQHYRPASRETALHFLSDCFHNLLHKPRSYHDFFCQQQTLAAGHIMDFPITHPISVEFWTIYLTRSGAGEIDLQGGKIELGTGTIALVPPGCQCVIARHPQHESWQFDWLNVRSRPEWFELMDWAFSLNQPMVITVNDAALLQQVSGLMQELESISYQRGDINERLCHNIIENLLIRLRRLSEELEPVDSDPRIRKAVHYLLPRYREDLSLEDVAAQVNLSPSRLNALFRQHYGISLIKWRDRMRLQKAQELVNHTTMPIGQIASYLGYEDPLYFSRRFSKQFGMAPSQLRKSRGPAQAV